MLITKGSLAVRKLASRDANRWVINSVFIEDLDKSIRVTATNGYMMAVVTSPKTENEEADFPEVKGLDSTDNEKFAIIDTASVEKLVKQMTTEKTNDHRPPFLFKAKAHLGKEQSQFAVTDLASSQVMNFKNIDGSYPATQHILSDTIARPYKAKILLDASYVKEVLSVMAEAVNLGDHKYIEFVVAGPEDPVYLRARNKQTGELVETVIMPVKGECFSDEEEAYHIEAARIEIEKRKKKEAEEEEEEKKAPKV